MNFLYGTHPLTPVGEDTIKRIMPVIFVSLPPLGLSLGACANDGEKNLSALEINPLWANLSDFTLLPKLSPRFLLRQTLIITSQTI